MSIDVGGTKSFKRYALETAAVLSGILIAFGLDAGWGLVLERSETRESLSTLRREFENTRAQLDSVVAVNVHAIGATEAFLDMVVADLQEISDDSLRTLRLGLERAETFDPGESALAALVSGNILERVPGEELRDLVAGWSGRVNDLREEQAEVRRAEAAIHHHLATAMILIPPLGRPRNSLSGLDVLEQRMSDEQTRQLYGVRLGAVGLMLVEQRGLSEATDRILELLEAALD
jgi:hypothetical protein